MQIITRAKQVVCIPLLLLERGLICMLMPILEAWKRFESRTLLEPVRRCSCAPTVMSFCFCEDQPQKL